MSAWRKHVMRCTDLTPAERLVLIALGSYADYCDGTNAHPGIERLSVDTALSRTAVEGALRKARRLNLIQVTTRQNPKLGHAAVYQLLPVGISSLATQRLENDFNPHDGEARNDFKPHEGEASSLTTLRPTFTSTPQVTRNGYSANAS
jgi:hypothetical protein